MSKRRSTACCSARKNKLQKAEPVSGLRSSAPPQLSETDRFLSNADCWAAIFGFLDHRSRAKCTILCQSLYPHFDALWKKQTHFDFDGVISFTDCVSKSRNVSKWWAAATAVCSEIGEHLRSLKMSTDLSMREAKFNEIVDHCPRLERIDFFASRRLSPALRFDQLKNLKEFNVLGTQCALDEVLRGSCLEETLIERPSLSSTLEKLLGLRGGEKRHVRGFERFFVEHRNLKEFELTDSDFGSSFSNRSNSNANPFPLFALIVANCARIERLTALNCRNVSFLGIEKFANLKFLNVSDNVIVDSTSCLTDEQVVCLSNQNRFLEGLRIARRDYRLGFRSWKAIATLSCLRDLELSGYRHESVPAFTNASLQVILDGAGVSLQRLSLDSACDLNDKSVDLIGAHCPNLRLFIVRDSLSSVTISAAALQRLIDRITLTSPTWDAAKQTLELRLTWFDSSPSALSYAALANSQALPVGVIVCRSCG